MTDKTDDDCPTNIIDFAEKRAEAGIDTHFQKITELHKHAEELIIKQLLLQEEMSKLSGDTNQMAAISTNLATLQNQLIAISGALKPYFDPSKAE